MRGKKTELVLQRPTETADSQGALSKVWRDLRTINGVLTSSPSVKSGLVDIYSKNTEVSTHIFIIDFPIGVTISVDDRFRNGTDYYEVLYVANPGLANRHLEIHLLLTSGVSNE